MKAMILAAGLGERLRPLTTRTAKPALPVLNVPVIMFVLNMLRKSGIMDVCINLHYLPQTIIETIKPFKKQGMNILWSFEEEILGTGGGVWKMQEFLKDDTFVVVNGDSIINLDLEKVIEFHLEKKGLATLVLRENEHLEQFGRITIDDNHRVVKILDFKHGNNVAGKNTMFTGVHVVDPKIFELKPEKLPVFDSIRNLYIPMMIGNNPIYGYLFDGYWADTGTLSRYHSANMAVLHMFVNGQKIISKNVGTVITSKHGGGKSKVMFQPPVVHGKNCSFGKDCVLGHDVIIGDNVVIGNNVRLKNTVVLRGTHIADNSDISNCIIDHDTTIFV